MVVMQAFILQTLHNNDIKPNNKYNIILFFGCGSRQMMWLPAAPTPAPKR
jgi:hypothetical protein